MSHFGASRKLRFENTSGKLEEKIGILKLEAGEEFFAKLVIEGEK